MNKRHVSQSSCAEIFGVHRNTVANWIKQGCPYVQKANKKQGKDWVLDTADVAQWRADKAVQDTVGDTEAATEDELRRRKLAADTQLAELEVGKKRGELRLAMRAGSVPRHSSAGEQVRTAVHGVQICGHVRVLVNPPQHLVHLHVLGVASEGRVQARREFVEAKIYHQW